MLLLESMNGQLIFLGNLLIVIGVPAFVAGLTLCLATPSDMDKK